jgi:predicted ATP-binding protein involved in virulence
MKIREIEVINLFGKSEKLSSSLNADINIITGRNGSGKTTVMKLIWYVMSGNIIHALREVNFDKVKIVTDVYECTVVRLGPLKCKVEMVYDGVRHVFEDEDNDPEGPSQDAEDQAQPYLIQSGKSVFFPTFRRIEGGFTLETRRVGSGIQSVYANPPRGSRQFGDVEEALIALSRRLSNGPHVFVSSISTVDIVNILMREYTDLSESYNNLQQKTSREIIEQIKEFKSDAIDAKRIDAANNVLDNIKLQIEQMESMRNEIMNPISTVQSLVAKLFKHSGIRIGTKLNFGDAATAINSEALSAGEKQLLSFICYNAFYKDSVIFIDEPELSLHVDWQRQMFSILQKQNSTNQFIVATHSPFVYTKYSDKEVALNSDRGDDSNELVNS